MARVEYRSSRGKFTSIKKQNTFYECDAYLYPRIRIILFRIHRTGVRAALARLRRYANRITAVARSACICILSAIRGQIHAEGNTAAAHGIYWLHPDGAFYLVACTLEP